MDSKQSRLQRHIDSDDVILYLSGTKNDKLKGTTNLYSNQRTEARKYSARLNVTWQMEDEKVNLHHGQSIICRTIRNNWTLRRFNEVANLPNQGKVMQCVQLSKSSSHFLATGYLTRFADWRFTQGARLNLLPLNSSQ